MGKLVAAITTKLYNCTYNYNSLSVMDNKGVLKGKFSR